MMAYVCTCCAQRGERSVCSCVFGTCRRCTLCVKHCGCPERHARVCEDTDLDDPDGPFGHVPPHSTAASESA